MGFGKTNPNFISENKVLDFYDGRFHLLQAQRRTEGRIFLPSLGGVGAG
jgi:hypothetical protein